MPLIESSSHKAVLLNTQELIASGRKPAQAYAIAKRKQREVAAKMAARHAKRKGGKHG